MSKDTFFFPHDYNARNDPKILAMRTVYGAEGYGWYWMILEMFREEPTHKLCINKYTYETLASQLQTDITTVEKFINDCCNEFKNGKSSLFSTNGEYLWSDSFLRRMEYIDTKREKARKSALKRWGAK